MLIIQIFLIFCSLHFIYARQNEIALIKEFIIARHLKFIHLYMPCWERQDLHNLQKTLGLIGVRHAFGPNEFTLRLTVADLECSGYEELKEVLHATNKQLIFTSNVINLQEYLPKIQLDTDLTVAIRSRNWFDLWGVFNPGVGIKFVKFTSPKQAITYKSRLDMKGVVIRVGTMITEDTDLEDEIYLKDFRNKYLDGIHKMGYELFQFLQIMHGFDINLTIFRDYKTLENALMQNIIDVAATSTFLSPKIISSFDLLMPTYRFRTAFLFRNPGNFEGRNAFLEPMASEVWYATLGCTIAVIVLLKLVFVFDEEMNEDANEVIKLNCEEGKAWSAVISDTWAIFIQQGSTFEPTCISGKIILFTYLFLCVLLFNYYTSVMVSDLLSLPPPPFKNLNQLRKSAITMGVQDEAEIFSMFQDSTDWDVHEVLSSKITPIVVNITQGVTKMMLEQFALYGHADSIYDLINKMFDLKEICDVNEIGIFEPQQMYGLARKNSQYKKIFLISYRRMMENGIYNRILKKWSTPQPPCLANRDVMQVSLGKCMPAYNMFIGGCMFSLIFLCVEKFRRTKKYAEFVQYLKRVTDGIRTYINKISQRK